MVYLLIPLLTPYCSMSYSFPPTSNQTPLTPSCRAFAGKWSLFSLTFITYLFPVSWLDAWGSLVHQPKERHLSHELISSLSSIAWFLCHLMMTSSLPHSYSLVFMLSWGLVSSFFQIKKLFKTTARYLSDIQFLSNQNIIHSSSLLTKETVFQREYHPNSNTYQSIFPFPGLSQFLRQPFPSPSRTLAYITRHCSHSSLVHLSSP